MMKIQELYDKDISRRINPAVVVSEMDEYFINQEIEEYVFTQGITKNIYTFLNAIVNKKEGKTGAWISGYYGSGKSHFIKYLFYCLNEKYREKAFQIFKDSVKNVDPLDEPNMGLVADLQNKLNNLKVAEIIFNIDAVSDNYGEKERITRVLLNQLNAFRGYNDTNIALALYLEKPLHEKGKFEEFKKEIKATLKEDWEGNQVDFVEMYLNEVIDIAKKYDPLLDKESLRKGILNENKDFTIKFLIDELKDFLSTQDGSYKLLFLIDEVSQYIGSNTSLLLNLQTIVEEIGSQIGPNIWIVCTAQQDLSNLIDNTDSKTEDFGKILGRFETLISLESQDAAFITKKRVLDKNSDGMGALNDFYKGNKGAIENQFVFDHDLYENYGDRDDFTLTYPFIPYQFRLISDVFESFSNVGYVGEGVKNTERAILGITHFTANLCKDDVLGYFVPFDLFFNEQFEKNITHLARGILDRAYHIDQVKTDVFSRRVVNTLFMISNLGESQSVNFPANIENLYLLLMDSVDTAKLEMQNKVQKVLDLLVSKNIIQVAEGKYRFLKEDEIEVAHLIKSTTITNQDRLDYIYSDIISKTVKPNPNVNSFGNRNFKFSLNIDDKEEIRTGEFNIRFSIYDSTEVENLAHATPSQNMVVAISQWLKSDNDLKGQILEYVRTQKYIWLNSSTATGTRTETLNNFRETNKLLLQEILLRFEKKFLQTPIVSNNQVIEAGELNGNNPSTRFEDMVKRHMEDVYRKHELSNGYAKSNADLIANAGSTQKQIMNDLTPAEEEVNTKITLSGEAPVVGDIVKAFEKAPFGWKDISTLDMLLGIGKKGFRRFEWRNEEIDFKTFADKALNSRERDAISIHREKVHSQEEINNFIHVVNNEIFAETIIPSNTSDFKAAVEGFKNKLKPKITSLNQLKDEYEGFPFSKHLKSFHSKLSGIYLERNPDQVVDMILAQKDQLKLDRDTYMFVEEFIEHNFKSYEQLTSFAEVNKNNFDSLDETLIVRAEDLLEYLKSDNEPWEKFPQMKKAFKELNDAIKNRLNSLKANVIKLYETILLEIEARQKELGIDAPNLTTNAEWYLQKINKEIQIAQLEIYELKANDFRAENFKRLEDYKAGEEARKTGKEMVTSLDVSIAAEMPPTTISNEEQLDEYLKKLKAKLMVKLSKKQKLWLS
ncbi:MAG: BREX system P-loop protein BrxC [Candidatus Paceibacterota bacterium]